MSKNSTVSLTLQLKGQQAQDVINRLQQSQTKNTNELLRTNQHLESVLKQQATHTQLQAQQLRQLTQINQANTRTITQQTTQTQAGLRTNQLLERVLQQQTRQSTLQSQQLRNQNRDYQLQVNMLRQQAAAAERLRRELQGAGRESKQLSSGNITGMLGGAAASGMILSNAFKKPRDYDQQLTYIANTATGGKDLTVKDRIKAIDDLDNYVKKAVRLGGGTREDAAAAANTLIASGKYDLSNVTEALNASVKTAHAEGADANDAAQLTVKIQDFGVKDVQRGHNIAVRGAQLGSFEYKDQAKWLSQQTAAAKAIGYSGEKGLIELVALNQVAMTTAANANEAGNNVVNLLGKLSSREFSDSISKVVSVQAHDPTKLKGKKKPKEVFDWSTYAIQQREQGVYGVEAFVKLLDRQLKDNKQYQKLQARMSSAKTPNEKQATLEDMSNIAMGSELGQIIADRQALMAALSVIYNKDTLNNLRKELPNSNSTVDDDFKVVQSREWAKDQATNQEGLFAQSKAYNTVAEALGNIKDKITETAKNHETLAAVAYSTALAIGALGASAAASSLLGRGGAAAAGGTAGRLGAGAIAGGAAATVGGQVVLAGALGYGVGTAGRNIYMQTERGRKFDSALTDTLGSDITELMAFLGNQEAKETMEEKAKYDAMIAEQQKNTDSINQGFLMLAQTVRDSKPVIPNFPAIQSSTTLAQSIANHGVQQEQRHGAVIPFALK